MPLYFGDLGLKASLHLRLWSPVAAAAGVLTLGAVTLTDALAPGAVVAAINGGTGPYLMSGAAYPTVLAIDPAHNNLVVGTNGPLDALTVQGAANTGAFAIFDEGTGLTTPFPAGLTITTGKPTAGVLPTITGNKQVGSVQTVNPGPWTGSPTFTYQWFDATTFVDIPGATSVNYTPLIGQSGDMLDCRLTATSGATSRTVTCGGIGPVLPNAVPAAVTAPKLSGVNLPGNVVTVAQGSYTNAPTSITTQLKLGATVVLTGPGSYTVPAGNTQTLQISEFATNGIGNSTTQTSNTLKAVEFYDNFSQASGTIISSRLPNIGGNWISARSGWTIDGANRVFSSQYQDYLRTPNISSADMFVMATTTVLVPVGASYKVTTRDNGTNHMRFGFDAGSAGWAISKSINGVETIIGTPVTVQGNVSGFSAAIRGESIGTTHNLYINGSLVLSVTDASVTAVGGCGMDEGNTDINSSAHFANFIAGPA